MHLFKRKILKYRRIILPAFFAVVFLLFIYIFLRFSFPLYKFAKDNGASTKFVLNLILGKKPDLQENEGRSNFLVLGISGGSHEGADLTDTMIFASFDFEKKDLVLVSIPRDIWLPSLKTKINSSYHFGEKKKEGGGMILVKSSVSEVLGVPVNYAYILDFEKFKGLIDLVSGVDVNVENSFEDKKFPITGKEEDFCGGDPTFACRYEEIKFKRGIQHMDGTTALKYVRSRYSQDSEGTDFSRSKRQQDVIRAFATRILDLVKTGKISILINLADQFFSKKSTDMNLAQGLEIGKFVWDNRNLNIRNLTLDTGDKNQNRNGYLINPPLWQYDGLWVLAPRSGNFDEIHEYIKCNLKDINCDKKP